MKEYISSLLLCAASAVAVNATSPDVALTSSKLASGHWVKVHIDSDGIYAFSDERLRELGFDNPEAVRVYGYGTGIFANHKVETSPVDLPQIASAHLQGQLVFYGRGECSFTFDATAAAFFTRSRNYYALGGTYYLSDAPAAEDIFTQVDAPEELRDDALTSHLAFVFHEEQTINYPHGGAAFHGNDFKSAAADVYSLRIVNPAAGEGSLYACSSIGVDYSEYTSYRASDKGKDYVYFNWGDGVTHSAYTLQTPAPTPPSSYSQFTNTYLGETVTFDASIDDATYTFSPYVSGPSSYQNFAANVYWGFKYARRNDLTGISQMLMLYPSVEAEQQFYVTGAASPQVWGIDDPAHPVSYQLNADNAGQFAGSASNIRLVAFDAAGSLPEPEVLSNSLENQNIHGMEVPDMVIVAPSLFLKQAEELAQLHKEYQDLDVAVIEQQKVFNEFSSGVAHPMAVRRMMQMFYERNPEKIKALLLYGSATNVQHTALTPESPYVIVAENEDNGPLFSYSNYTQNFCTDSYFAKVGAKDANRTATNLMYATMLQDMMFAVGRLPINSLAQAEAYNAKARNYLANPPSNPVPNNALFVADFAAQEEDPHMADTEDISKHIGADTTSVTRIRAYSNFYTAKSGITSETTTDSKMLKNLIANSLQRGVNFMCFFGHGSNAGIGFWQMGDPQSYPYSFTPMMMFGTCEGADIDTQDSGLYTDLTFTENGGSIGLIGSCRTVVQTYNREFGEYFSKSYFGAEDGALLGDTYRNAHNGLIAAHAALGNLGSKYILNTFAYNFVGDPAMPLYSTTRTAAVTAINNEAVSNDATARMVPGAVNTFTGTITDADGNVDKSFNGTVVITVFDCPFTATNHAGIRSGGTQAKRYIASLDLDHEALTEITGTVSDGVFTASGYISNPMREGSTNRINVYATNDARSTRARGALLNATIQYNADTDADMLLTEADAPVISEAYIENPENNGGVAFSETTLTLHAEITAPAGLRKASQLDNSITLTIDGTTVGGVNYSAVANPDKTYSLDCAIADLGNGPHTAVLTVVDNLGQTASTELEFSVFTNDKVELLLNKIATTDNIDIALAEDVTLNYSRLIIEDAAGNTIKDISDVAFPYTWDLKSDDGARVSMGVYRTYALLKSGNNYMSTSKGEFIVK